MSPDKELAIGLLVWLAASAAAVAILCRIMGANRDDDGGGPRK